MNFNFAFSYALEDREWLKKFSIGALVSLIPIINFAWMGYITDIMRDVSRNTYTELPDWSDFGEKLVKGLKISAAALIYSLPILLIGVLPLIGVLISSLSENPDLESALASTSAALILVFSCCILLYAVFMSFAFPAVHLHFAREGTFKSCFELKKILQLITLNSGNYLMAWGISIIFGLVIGMVAGLVITVLALIPCIGWILAIVIPMFVNIWVTTVYSHLFGQVSALSPID